MGLFSKLRSKFSGFQYRINREILLAYFNEVITFATQENQSFCDEFYLSVDTEGTNKIHLTIINYDAPCDESSEEEKGLKGIVIYVNEKGYYSLTKDKKYYQPQDFIDTELINFPEQFILLNELAGPVSLEPYKI